MAKLILTDELWAAIEPLLPVHVPSPNGGHPRVSDRAALWLPSIFRTRYYLSPRVVSGIGE